MGRIKGYRARNKGREGLGKGGGKGFEKGMTRVKGREYRGQAKAREWQRRQDSNTQSTALEASTLTITPQMLVHMHELGAILNQ